MDKVQDAGKLVNLLKKAKNSTNLLELLKHTDDVDDLAKLLDKIKDVKQLAKELENAGGSTKLLEQLNKVNDAAKTVNPFLKGLTPQAGTRATGVARATKLEVELVQKTGQGTTNWTAAEIQYIKQNGRLPPGTVGHHINSVVPYAEWSGDPRNIVFVRGQAGNLLEHGGNFTNSTTGPLIDRQAILDTLH